MERPEEKELWVVRNDDTDVELTRTVLIYNKNEKGLMEVLLCNSDLSLSTSTTVKIDEPHLDLKYSLGINLDLMSNMYDTESQFVRKIGNISDESFEAIRNLIDGPDPSQALTLERGEKLVFKSDRRWVSKKNEILVSHILSMNAEYVGNLFADIEDIEIDETVPELGIIFESLPSRISMEEHLIHQGGNKYRLEKIEQLAVAV